MDGICSILLGLRGILRENLWFLPPNIGVSDVGFPFHPVPGCSGNMQHTYSGESVCTEFGQCAAVISWWLSLVPSHVLLVMMHLLHVHEKMMHMYMYIIYISYIDIIYRYYI